MTEFKKTIQQVDLTKVDENSFKHHYVGCIILTYNNKFLLQEIVDARPFFPAGNIVTFGGKIESGESPIQVLIRELREELGALANADDVISLGAITEEITGHSELIYTYFWHDKSNTITGCYEDKAKYFDTIKEILGHSKVTDDVRWMLNESLKQKLINKKGVSNG